MNIGGIGYPGSIMRNTGITPKSSSAWDRNPIAPANNCVNTFSQTALKNASQEFQDAWNKAEDQSRGFNPLTDAVGKIAGSSLLARHMEMEYNLMLRYGAKEARIRTDNVFANKDSAKSLIRAALERAKGLMNTDLILDQAQGYTSPASFLVVTLS